MNNTIELQAPYILTENQTVKTATATARRTKKPNALMAWIKDFHLTLISEEKRFAVIPMALIIVCCLGGCVMGTSVDGSLFQMSVITFSTMSVLTGVLAVAPMKFITYASFATVFFNLLIVLYNIM